MTGPLYAIGRFCSRHHYPVIGLWVVLAIALIGISQASGSKTSENLTLPGTDSTVATELLEDNLPEQGYGSNPLTFEATKGTLAEAKYANAIAATTKNLEAIPFVNSAIDPLSPEGKASGLVSKDGKIAYTPVVLGIGPGEIDEALKAANAIGDDTLQRQTQGRVVPDSFTHGTSEQRVRWFKKGFESGDVRGMKALFTLPYGSL